MPEIEPVWCVKENRGPWHGTSTGHARSEENTVIFALCQTDVFRESGTIQECRQPDCPRCLAILSRRAMREAAEADDNKQGVLF